MSKQAREATALARADVLVKLQQLIIRARREGLSTTREVSRFLRQHRSVLTLPPEMGPVGVSHTAVSFWLVALQFETGRQHRRTGKRTGARRQLLEAG